MANYTVVVAEDEVLLLDNLIGKIHQLDMGFQVVGKAQTGTQAYDLVKELEPDLLITDIRIPLINGIELLEQVSVRCPLTKTIILSGFSDFEYAQSAIRLGVVEYLLKPVEINELKNALERVKEKYEIEKKTYTEIFNPGMTQKSPEQIARVLRDYLIHHYATDINLKLIADNMNYSPSYLTKIFDQQYHTTPSKYIINLRITQAKHYILHEPELSIRQIGEMVGYNDQGYFSRIFKKKTGLSPFDYRENPPESVEEAPIDNAP